MKEKCDNICETCPMATQVHCVLVYSKATNASVGALADKLKVLEDRVNFEQPNLLNPFEEGESEKLPALEVGGKTI